MTVEELNTKFYERMYEEQEQFRSELLGKSPQMFDHAYEYVMREDCRFRPQKSNCTEKKVHHHGKTNPL